MFKVKWCEWDKIVNKHFIPLLNNKDRYVIMYGGRGSSKSNFEAKKLIYRCLTENYFRHILIRNTYATIKDSSYQTIKDIIFELGLQELFEFKLQPLEIHCINGNCFLARGCDDTQKIKSVKDPTGAWWEEDIPSEADFITVTTSIRTTKAAFLQETFTINPEVEGNYQDHWFWKRFFKGRTDLSFRDATKMKVNEDTEVELTYTVHHSDHTHNKWIPAEFIAFLMDLKTKNPYYWEVYCNGKWGNKQLGGRFYKSFDLGKNTLNYNYNPSLPLHISFDFNVNPYVSLSVWQQEGKRCYLIDEIAMEYPKNRTTDACREFTRRYNSHTAGLFVYGDPSGKQEGTRTEAGHNDYKIIQNELEKFRPVLRVFNSHPPVKTRGDFINAIFEYNFDDCFVYISENSVFLKNDLLFGLEDSDGTKLKQKVKGEDGRSYEKHHHFSDNMDYYLCYTLSDSFYKFQNGMPNNYKRTTGIKPIGVNRL
jgi:PBSX family phage terminase large subunit